MISKTTKKTTYKATAIGFAAFFALMMTPSGAFSTSTDSAITAYGMAEVVQRNGDGEILASSVVHNQLVDNGEEFILNAVFKTADAALADGDRINTVCISTYNTDAVGGTPPAETDTSALAVGTTGDSCGKADATIMGTGATAHQAQIGPITFTTGTNINAGETVNSVAVCITDASDTLLTDCPAVGSLFALVDVTNVSPTGTDTVDVTYTFDLSSNTS